MFKGFRNFLMRGDVIVVAVGLIVALAFSTLISSFTTNVISPLIARAEGSNSVGLGWHLGASKATFLDLGAFISAVLYFVIFMAVIYFVIVLPYKSISARQGRTVFGPPAPVKTCPACLSSDLPAAATKCKYCATDQPATATG